MVGSNDQWDEAIQVIDDYRWLIPRETFPGMRVDGKVYADRSLMEQIRTDQALQQVANVAHLPGIVAASLAMPDIHWGYGFPVGGVAATDAKTGVVSPGGIGFDCNCGIRVITTNLQESDVRPRLSRLMDQLVRDVPTGVGSGGKLKLKNKDLNDVLAHGMRWAVENDLGWPEDLESVEDGGCIRAADPDVVSPRAKERGRDQLGTLGSGNHFIEISVVRKVFNLSLSRPFRLDEGRVVIMIHSGSRGLGHQVATDYVRLADAESRKQGYNLPDRQLACAPIDSAVGQDYLAALAAASNFAWANRQAMTQWVREAFTRVLGVGARDLEMFLLYDHAHNIAKFEQHVVNGVKRRLLVHRKGACRAFPAGHPDLPPAIRPHGQPVFVPGDMQTGSYILVGTEQAMQETFGSLCHGAGRQMSRSAARREIDAGELRRSLAEDGIEVRGVGGSALVEEAPRVYKDVSHVVNVMVGAGLAQLVARLEPMGVLKG